MRQNWAADGAAARAAIDSSRDCRRAEVGPVEMSWQSDFYQPGGRRRCDHDAFAPVRAHQPVPEFPRLLRIVRSQHDGYAPVDRRTDERREDSVNGRSGSHTLTIHRRCGSQVPFPCTPARIHAGVARPIERDVRRPQLPPEFRRSSGSCPDAPRRATTARHHRCRAGSRRGWRRTAPRAACRRRGLRHA